MVKNSLEQTPPPVLVAVTRGGIVESHHRGHVAVLSGDGRVLFTLGNPQQICFVRSSAKPFQAVPLILSGAADHFGLTEQEIAVACGSHAGEPSHLAAVDSMLRKIGLNRSALRCGATGSGARSQGVSGGQLDSAIRDNCSGKHAGMLAVSQHRNCHPSDYLDPAGLVQRGVLEVISCFTGIPLKKIDSRVDGCGAPTFALSLAQMAGMFARIGSPGGLPDNLRSALDRIVKAIIRHPEMIAGNGLADTELIKIGRGEILVKSGAEGVVAATVFPSVRWPFGLGIAIKIEDGASRPRPLVVTALLHHLGVLAAGEWSDRAPWLGKTLLNRSGQMVGDLRLAIDFPSLAAG